MFRGHSWMLKSLKAMISFFRWYFFQYIYIYWLVVWSIIFPYVGNVIIPTDFHFFRGVGIPPTSIYIYIPSESWLTPYDWKSWVMSMTFRWTEGAKKLWDFQVDIPMKSQVFPMDSKWSELAFNKYRLFITSPLISFKISKVYSWLPSGNQMWHLETH